jgi:tetratricopeptide (TPR) repeat protein
MYKMKEKFLSPSQEYTIRKKKSAHSFLIILQHSHNNHFISLSYHIPMMILTAILLFLFAGNDYIDKGDEYYRSGDNTRAAEEYQKAVRREPGNTKALARLIRVYNDCGRMELHHGSAAEEFYRKSIPLAEELLRLSPSDPAAHFWMALSRGGIIQFSGVREKIRLGKDVRDHASRAIALDSSFSYPYVILAVFERESAKLSWLERTFARVVFGEDLHGSLDLAERYLQKAIALDSENATALYELGWTYLEKKDTPRAIEAFRRVCAIPAQNARDRVQQLETQEKLRQLL